MAVIPGTGGAVSVSKTGKVTVKEPTTTAKPTTTTKSTASSSALADALKSAAAKTSSTSSSSSSSAARGTSGQQQAASTYKAPAPAAAPKPVTPTSSSQLAGKNTLSTPAAPAKSVVLQTVSPTVSTAGQPASSNNMSSSAIAQAQQIAAARLAEQGKPYGVAMSPTYGAGATGANAAYAASGNSYVAPTTPPAADPTAPGPAAPAAAAPFNVDQAMGGTIDWATGSAQFPYLNASDSTDYYNKLVAAKQAGVITEYEANASMIRNNLSKALSDLQAEQAALAPIYQSQLSTIAQNQFSSSEQMKEMMNQSGWSGTNSGLAIGEQGKIAIGADKSRAQASQNFNDQTADINRRGTLANQTSMEDLAVLEKIKNNNLSQAEAEAYIANTQRQDTLAQQQRQYDLDYQQMLDARTVNDRNYQLAMVKQAADAYNATASSGSSSGSSSSSSSSAKVVSSNARRNATNEINTFYQSGNLSKLYELQNAIANDETLTAADFQSLNTYLQGKIADLEKNKPSTSSTTFRPAGSVYPRQASDYGNGL